MPSAGDASTTRRTASTPARCPAARGRPRRTAQRPLPSIMMATCRPSFPGRVLCIIKSADKIFSGACQARELGCRRRGFHRLGGIAHHLLEHGEIFEVARAALARDAAERLRPVLLEALGDLDEPGLLQH